MFEKYFVLLYKLLIIQKLLKMKITIDLTAAEVKALTAYLKEVQGKKIVTKEDIKIEIRGMVDESLQAGSLGDYYSQFN